MCKRGVIISGKIARPLLLFLADITIKVKITKAIIEKHSTIKTTPPYLKNSLNLVSTVLVSSTIAKRM